MTEQIIQQKEMENYEEDSQWFYKNIDNLRKQKLNGKFVAIKNKKVVASGKDIEVVVKAVEERGENPSCVLIEFVYPEGTVVLLLNENSDQSGVFCGRIKANGDSYLKVSNATYFWFYQCDS